MSFGDIRIASPLFADDVVVLASPDCDFQQALGRFAVECKAVRMRVRTVDCTLWVGSERLD